MGGQGDLRPISLEWSGIPLRDRAALFGSLRSSWQRKTRHSLAGLDGLKLVHLISGNGYPVATRHLTAA
jgi:hypothetical protein